MKRLVWATMALAVAAVLDGSGQPQFGQAVRGYIKVDAPAVVLTNLRVIDGSGASASGEPTHISGDAFSCSHR